MKGEIEKKNQFKNENIKKMSIKIDIKIKIIYDWRVKLKKNITFLKRPRKIK